MTHDRDPLRSLLHRKVREVSDEAAQHDGDVPSVQLDALNRLARLVEVRDKTPPAAPRWRVAVVLAGTLVLVSLLLFLRVRETEVELQLVTSEVGFVLAQPQVLTDVVILAELGASGLRDIQCSDPALSQWMVEAAQDEQKAIRVTAIEQDGKSGTVTLNPFNLPADVEVQVYDDRSPGACRVVLKGARTAVRTTLYGPLHIDLQGAGTQSPDLGIPRSLLLETDPGEVNLNLRFAVALDGTICVGDFVRIDLPHLQELRIAENCAEGCEHKGQVSVERAHQYRRKPDTENEGAEPEPHRDDPGHGCAVPTLGAEIARESPKTRKAFAAKIEQMIEMMADQIPDLPRKAARKQAAAALSTMMGTVVLARIAGSGEFSEEILAAGREAVLGRAAAATSAGGKPAKKGVKKASSSART